MYAGPVGWFGGAESEFAVGIRSALLGKVRKLWICYKLHTIQLPSGIAFTRLAELSCYRFSHLNVSSGSRATAL